MRATQKMWHFIRKDLLDGFYMATTTGHPTGLTQPKDLMTNKRLVMRYCSQYVSGLKTVSQPLAAGAADSEKFLMQWKLGMAAAASQVGPAVGWYATGGGVQLQG